MKTMVVKVLVLALLGVFIACDPQYDRVLKGVAEFQITDAPSDDEEIKSVFVTVADIKADGQSVSGFTRQTLDLKAYREGNTKLLATSSLIARTYSTLTLVLDADADVTGANPGCYVQTTDNSKFKLGSGMISIDVSNEWTVANLLKSAVIIDFDLRKSIRKDSNPSVRYNFVSGTNLQKSVRVASRDRLSALNGIYQDQSAVISDKVIVFAYKKGTYEVSEQSPSGDDQVTFAHAVTSAEVRGDQMRTFNLAFLEEGEYELHFASYKYISGGLSLSFQTMLAADLTINGTMVETIKIKRGESQSLSALITGSM